MSAASASAIACEPPSATTHPLACAGDEQHQPDGAGQRTVEAVERVRGHAGPERLGLLLPPHPGQGGGRQHRRRRRSAPTVSGCRGTRRTGWVASASRSSKRAAIGPNTRRHRCPSSPETVGGPIDRSLAARRPNRRRADGHSPPPAAASVSPRDARSRLGEERRRRGDRDGTPSSDRAPARGRSSPSCACRRRSRRSPRAR